MHTPVHTRRKTAWRRREGLYVTLNNIGQTTGCQSGRAIVVWNTDVGGAAVSRDREQHRLELQQERDRRARQRRRDDPGNTVTGSGPVDHIAQNGIVVYGADDGRAGRGQQGQRERLHRAADTDATGILVIDAKVSIDRKNTLSGNEKDIDNDMAPSAASSAPNNKGRRGRNTNP